MNNELIIKLTDWIVANRRGNAFQDYSHNKIANEIKRSIEQDVIAVAVKDNQFYGVALGERDDDGQRIIIHDVLTTQPGVVRGFLIYCAGKYPTYSIFGLRHNGYKLIKNPTQLARRIR